ncbi:bifunctional diguanylate cyclase/phosphodiesterase [Pseudacidovorax sp. RU35E]|uniref:putative bifunctional diguanylate cyclase/phosphodiesterase n=1 Tax=Pseudacidovorax sp. RU35E TaxID=1907403 RepID=UPI0009552952|nr:EAL domain-containing protein [Pseudacidovorax sp. RU35E]SIQ53885.1 diguanylate cyclase (GGDEF) domain-containing protein [Pseudacidovorax sp. RU35E]
MAGPWQRFTVVFRSRWGWRIFLGAFVIVALPLLGVSLISYELTDALQRRATQRLMAEATKAANVNLYDRLRAAELLLRARAQAEASGMPNDALELQAATVFDGVVPTAKALAGPRSEVQLLPAAGGIGVQPVMRIAAPGGGSIEGRIRPEYLLENLASSSHTVCVQSEQAPGPHCLSPLQGHLVELAHARPLYMAPVFDGADWLITAAPQRDAYRFLPLGSGAALAQATGLAFLLALIASSFYSRRITRPLEALIEATRAVRTGDFGQRVDAAVMTDEFRELADSFNGMVGEIGADLAFSQVLAQMDTAILARQPLQDIAALALLHLTDSDPARRFAFRITPKDGGPADELVLDADRHLQHRAPAPNATPVHVEVLPVAQRADSTFTLQVDTTQATPWPARSRQETEALCARLAVAVQADERERQLVSRAVVDSLTGLLNRLGLVDALDQAMAQAAQRDDVLAVAFIDLDGFKDVNDAYGHSVGDRLLQQVAYRLRASLASADARLARMGGDEFVLMVCGESSDALHTLLQGVLTAMQQPFRIDALDVQIGASIGVAAFPDHGRDHETLLKNADAAMYAAKSGGRNRVVDYTSTLNASTAERLELRRSLAGALAAGQLFLLFQPRVRAIDGVVASAEVLLRWQHPVKGRIPPDRFIPIAEEAGLIGEIGLWVLREAMQQVSHWRMQANPPLTRLSVNLSPLQLAHRDFVPQVEALAAAFPLARGAIELEITEGAFFRDIEGCVHKLGRLRAMGFDIALDDFGVGYSAMSYLSTLPLDTLKIDKSFVQAFGQQTTAYAIASAIVALAAALDKRVVAEGVETEAQAALLRELGVDELQGYLFSAPVPVEALVLPAGGEREQSAAPW